MVGYFLDRVYALSNRREAIGGSELLMTFELELLVCGILR